MKNEIQKCIDHQDIDGLLEIYEDKGLLAKTASILRDARKSDFENWLMRKLKVPNNRLLQAIKSVLPELS
jgi:ABC transporter, ATP-binding protein-related protein